MKKILTLIFILLPLFSFAQIPPEYQLLEPLPCIDGTGQKCTDGAIKSINTNGYIVFLFKFSIAFAAVAAVVVIIISGFQYATTDIISSKGSAVARIQSALMGLVTILASILILQTIDPRLVQINTFLEPLNIKGYEFRYNELLESATFYQIEQTLKDANQEMSVLRKNAEAFDKRAAEIRAKEATSAEDRWNNEIEAQKFDQRAKQLRLEADRVGHEAALDSVYLKVDEVMKTISSGTLTDTQKADLERVKQDIINTSNEDIEKMKKKNDIEGVQALQRKQSYNIEKINQDVLLKTSIEAIRENQTLSYTDLFVSIEDIKKRIAEKNNKIVSDIQKYTVQNPNLSLEQVNQLNLEKRTALEEIDKLIKK
jgi:hypothetical protein